MSKPSKQLSIFSKIAGAIDNFIIEAGDSLGPVDKYDRHGEIIFYNIDCECNGENEECENCDGEGFTENWRNENHYELFKQKLTSVLNDYSNINKRKTINFEKFIEKIENYKSYEGILDETPYSDIDYEDYLEKLLKELNFVLH